LTPDEVGLIDYGARRRSPGLRREEVAQLAGISIDYYVRLEQGRSPHVSQNVVDSVCRALRLSSDERDHLYNLVKPLRRPTPGPEQRVRPALRSMIQSLDTGPAYLLGRRMEVLAMNHLAALVFPGLDGADRVNLARFVFLNPAATQLFVDRQNVARSVAAYLRMDGGRFPNDPELAALVNELSVESDEFRRVWSEHPVADRTYGTKRLQHPVVGSLTLAYETLRTSDEDLMVVVFHAATAESATSMKLLASWGTPVPDRRGDQDLDPGAQSV
jgi:transcriptional regulator with XRE-family HTH domain